MSATSRDRGPIRRPVTVRGCKTAACRSHVRTGAFACGRDTPCAPHAMSAAKHAREYLRSAKGLARSPHSLRTGQYTWTYKISESMRT